MAFVAIFSLHTFGGCLILLIALISALKYAAFTKLKNKNLPPEVAGAWPILGHLPILDGQTIPLARILAGWADEYGPVFSIRLGIPRYMVVSSWEAVRDCFTGNDKVFAARPDALAGKYLGYNNARFSFSSYGPYWRKGKIQRPRRENCGQSPYSNGRRQTGCLP